MYSLTLFTMKRAKRKEDWNIWSIIRIICLYLLHPGLYHLPFPMAWKRLSSKAQGLCSWSWPRSSFIERVASSQQTSLAWSSVLAWYIFVTYVAQTLMQNWLKIWGLSDRFRKSRNKCNCISCVTLASECNQSRVSSSDMHGDFLHKIIILILYSTE